MFINIFRHTVFRDNFSRGGVQNIVVSKQIHPARNWKQPTAHVIRPHSLSGSCSISPYFLCSVFYLYRTSRGKKNTETNSAAGSVTFCLSLLSLIPVRYTEIILIICNLLTGMMKVRASLCWLAPSILPIAVIPINLLKPSGNFTYHQV
jgi:hypothetical protein